MFFYSLNLGSEPNSKYLVPLLASIITVIIFAYGIWGKANPYLMPTSSPRSSPCTRSVRHFGTGLLTLLWLTSTLFFATNTLAFERVYSGWTLLIAILIAVEAISSSRLGREQRRILKEEERRVEFEKVAGNSGSTVVAAATDFRKHKNNSRDSGLGSLGDNDRSMDNNGGGEDELTGVEIVRPEAIDLATAIYNQQILFESAQRHYHQQYQQYLIHQPHDDNASGDNNGGDGEQLEGKYDDILLESSYKFEIPMDESYNNNTGKPSSSTLPARPSSLYSLSSPSSNEKLHLPSAPPASSHTYTYPSPPRAPQEPATPTSFSPSFSFSPSSSTSTTKEAQRMSVLKNEISPVGIQFMEETNPFGDKDYQAATELSATAPPYELSSTESSSPFVQLNFGEQNSGSDHGSPFSNDVTHSSYSNNRATTPTSATAPTAMTTAAAPTTRWDVTKDLPRPQ
ncbi:hypothetical protein KI688_001808 [Linnemannia hyalina]|uniref:Uncharacterized protein n=1 Tax=Linnemannia hyalina TaxID=64524 RepID=A0A9P7XQG6_9FUNG|nr:hypothetical protein KI688_001808 [Linnemannia hyalina]